LFACRSSPLLWSLASKVEWEILGEKKARRSGLWSFNLPVAPPIPANVIPQGVEW